MKIVRVVNELRLGGVQIRLARVAREMVRRGHEVVIVCTEAEGINADGLRQDGVRVELVRTRKWNKVPGWIKMALFLRRERPDIVHSHTFRQNVPATIGAVLARVPGIFAQIHSPKTYRREDWKRYDRFLNRFRSAVLAVSRDVADDIRGSLEPTPPPRLEVLYNGVELEPFRALDRKACRAALLEEFGWPDENLVFLHAGRLNKLKNQVFMLRAFKRVSERIPHARLLLAGGGELEDEVKAAHQELELREACVLAGHRDDVPRLLTGADAFVFPSLSEGFANALLEALAAGCPVLCSTATGNEEIVKDGRNGFVHPVSEEDKLVETWIRLGESSELRERMRAANLEDVNRFSLETMVDRTLELYQEALDRRGKPFRR